MINIYHKNKMIVSDVLEARTFIQRLCGYMFRSKPHVPGILFFPAISIHTFFMKFSIDVIFMDKDFKIIRIYRKLKPWRHTYAYLSSRYTLEIPGGEFPNQISEGDILEVKYV
jgi:uncharacterized protein